MKLYGIKVFGWSGAVVGLCDKLLRGNTCCMILKKVCFGLLMVISCVAAAQSGGDKRVCITGQYRIMYKLSDTEVVRIAINGVTNGWLKENNMWNILSIERGKNVRVEILDFTGKDYINFNCSDVVITNLPPAKTFKATNGILLFKINKPRKRFSIKIKNATFTSMVNVNEVIKIKGMQFYGSLSNHHP